MPFSSEPDTGPGASSVPDLSRLAPGTRQVARAMALLWSFRTRSALHKLLRLLDCRQEDGRHFTLQAVGQAVDELQAAGCVVELPRREGYRRLVDSLRSSLYAELLADTMALDLQRALCELDSLRPEQLAYFWPLYDQAATIGIVRLAIFSGTPAEKMRAMAAAVGRVMDWDEVLDGAALEAFDPSLWNRTDPEWRWETVAAAVRRLNRDWAAGCRPVAEWALQEMESGGAGMPAELHLELAQMLMQRGEAARVEAALAPLDCGAADALRACLLAQAGRHADAQAAFENALKRRQAEGSARKRLFPAPVAWLYPLSLLARRSPAHLELARKFCLGEGGKRAPDPRDDWGSWVHVIGVRLGDAALDPAALVPVIYPGRQPGLADLWRLLLAAWLGPDPEFARGRLEEAAAALGRALAACGFGWLASQLGAAMAVLEGGEPPPGFFVSGRSEAWREVLAALQALGGGQEDTGVADAARLLWSIRLGPAGEVEEIQPFEQKRGSRGWSKPKPMGLARLAASESLSPQDARVARAVRPDRSHARRFAVDRAAAIAALVGHPAVVLAEAPEQVVELVEGQPEIEMARSQGGFSLRVTPPLRPEADRDQLACLSAEEQREEEALRAMTLIQDSPRRLRLVRFSAAQRRAAQLLAEGFEVPAAGQEELQKTLQALAGHFQIHADQARASREAPTDSRLRAELAPAGEDLVLRLVAAPLGPEGPRLAPGRGRARLMAAIGGDTVGTERDLAAETAHLDAVLAALDFLDAPDVGMAGCEWRIEDPETALDLVERLPALPAIAGLDWPKGKRLRVVPVDLSQLQVSVGGERDWFRVDGRADLDEGLVLQLSELLAAARGKSRFVPMGEGIYAALTKRLRQRLADLAALAEVAPGADGQALRLPRLAGAWLHDALDGTAVQADEAFSAAVECLRAAQEADIALPRGLQAELRPYQEEGLLWALRLAAAGFGACLADDMGLGKTLQALGVLLARAGGGPALVLAPTSVCGNWRAEAARFAPGLALRSYGEGDRAAALENLQAGDVVIASYALFQMAQEAFAAIAWHTVVVDEAQAIKNAEAKRSQAVFEVPAGFRLALSGTPVENRLAELWSIMRFVNPGLLGSLSRFNDAFAHPIERDHDRQAQQRLRRLVGPFLLRRTKAQVLHELPPRTEQLLAVSPDEAEAAHYEALRREAVEAADQALAQGAVQARFNILAQLTRLRRAACDPRLADPDFPGEGAKVQAFAELAAELSANGHKALVFSQFVDFLALLRAPLEAAGIPYQYLDGATPAAERTRRVAAFQAGEGDLFLISLKAGGFGLNLTAADYVVITDPWWNPAAEDQAMGRAHRMGQTRPVTVYRMVGAGTVEERIVALHQDKRALADSVLAEGEAAALPSTEDLVALLRGSLG